MREGPDISALAQLMGDPGRANMLVALLDGRALSAGELAREAGVSLPTASGHLTRLVDGGLLSVAKQGRHRYFRLSGPEVADAMTALMVLSDQKGRARVRTGPKDAQMRFARSCYSHIAGEMGVRIYDSLRARRLIDLQGEGLRLTETGVAEMDRLGINLTAKGACRECLDWSERRMHLSGPLGTAILTHVLAKGWAHRDTGSRVLRFTPMGRRAFEEAFPLDRETRPEPAQ